MLGAHATFCAQIIFRLSLNTVSRLSEYVLDQNVLNLADFELQMSKPVLYSEPPRTNLNAVEQSVAYIWSWIKILAKLYSSYMFFLIETLQSAL